MTHVRDDHKKSMILLVLGVLWRFTNKETSTVLGVFGTSKFSTTPKIFVSARIRAVSNDTEQNFIKSTKILANGSSFAKNDAEQNFIKSTEI